MRPCILGAVLLASLFARADDAPEALRVRRAATPAERPPWMGATLSAAEGGEGIEVTSVIPGAPAEKAGLAAGDLLVAIEGKPISGEKDARLDQLRAAITGKRPGDKLVVTRVRDKAKQDVTIVLAERPMPGSKGKAHPELSAYHDAPAPSALEQLLAKEKMEEAWALVASGVAQTASVPATNEPLLPGAPDPFRLGEVDYALTNPLDAHLVVKGVVRDLADAAESGSSPAALLAALAREADLAPPPAALPPSAAPLKGDTLEALVDDLVSRIAQAQEDVKAALADLSDEERKFLARASVLRPQDHATPEETRRYFQLGSKVKREKMVSAACRVLAALGKSSLAALAKAPLPAGHVDAPPGVEGEVVLVKETPVGTVVVGGKGRHVYSKPFALVIDLGGEDVYEGACAAASLDLPVSVVIDLGGSDTFRSDGEPSQGSGHLGVGILIDVAGNDVYTAPSGSQGCGHLGVGVLLDMDGDDTWRADTLSQGAGVMGIGILAHLAGNSTWRVARQGQGYGAAGGAGLALSGAGEGAWVAGGVYADAESGLTQSMAQGFGVGVPPTSQCPVGVSGGIGLLVKVEGNATFTADDLCQGTGFWYGLGGLYHGRGEGRYVASRFAQGCGIASGVGVLVSGEGDDTYVCSVVGYAQGCGHLKGVGVLADYGGNETYVAGTVSQGAGNEGGIGLLADFGGDDAYAAKADSQGRGGSTEGKAMASFGILFDIGGTDQYTIGGERTVEEGKVSTRPNWGLLIDLEDKVHVR